MKRLLTLSVLLFSLCFLFELTHAQVPAPSPIASATPIASPTVAAALELPLPSPAPEVAPAPEKSFLEKILEALKSAGGIVSVIVVVFEIFVRVFPTKNPLSVLVPVKFFIDNLAMILVWASDKVLVPLINVANKSQEKLEPSK